MIGILRVFRRSACEPIHHEHADLKRLRRRLPRYLRRQYKASPHRVTDVGTSTRGTVSCKFKRQEARCIFLLHNFQEDFDLAFKSSSFRCF
jgi:hypothetical protein